MSRCENVNDVGYKNYGGRGITVDPHWHDLKHFIADMEPGFKPGLTLDRIDNDAGYSKSNCRWATLAQQGRNKRSNHWVEFNGERLILSDWSKRLGMGVSLLQARLKAGWPVEKAFTAPIGTGQGKSDAHAHWVTFKGETRSLAEWSRHLGIPYTALVTRIGLGWSVEDALTRPVARKKDSQ